MAQCEYEITNPPLRCRGGTYQNSHFCVLHTSKDPATPGLDNLFVTEVQAIMSAPGHKRNIRLKGIEFSATASRQLGDLLAHAGESVASVDLTEATFRGDVWILEKILNLAIRLNSATVMGGVTLWKSTFNDVVFSQGVEVSGRVNVQMCHFNGHLRFDSATFKDNIMFVDCHFDEAYFPLVKFRSTLWFTKALARTVTFAHAEFSCDAAVLRLEADECSLEDAEIGDGARLRIEGGRDGMRWVLRSLRVGDKGSVLIDRVDLAGASFLRSDPTSFTFRDVHWPRLKGRRFLNDEMTVSSADMDALADNYRQLVLNHEKKRDYESAEDFHIGEMEMRRRASNYLRRLPGVLEVAAWLRERHPTVFRHGREASGWINAYGLYYLLSKYGTSYWRAAALLGVFVVAFAVGALYAGFTPVGDKGAGVIEYNLMRDSEHEPASLGQVCRDFGDAIVHVLEASTFQRERRFAPMDNWGRCLVVGATLVLPAQTALVLFALRRRFKR